MKSVTPTTPGVLGRTGGHRVRPHVPEEGEPAGGRQKDSGGPDWVKFFADVGCGSSVSAPGLSADKHLLAPLFALRTAVCS